MFVPSGSRSSPGLDVCLMHFTPETLIWKAFHTLRVTALSENLHPPCTASPCPPAPSRQRVMRTWPSPPTPATPPWPREPSQSSVDGLTSCLHRGVFDLHSWLDQGGFYMDGVEKTKVVRVPGSAARCPWESSRGFWVGCIFSWGVSGSHQTSSLGN